MGGKVYWIKLHTSTFDSESIALLESMPEGDTVLVIWLKMQILAGKCNAGGYLLLNGESPYSNEMLATVFRRPLNTVRLAISAFMQFNMIELVDGAYFLPEWEILQNVSGMDKIREQTKVRVARHRSRLKNVTLQVTESNEIKIDTETEPEKQQQEIRTLMLNTPFSRITDQQLRVFIECYGSKQVSFATDLAAETWRREKKEILNPSGYLKVLCESTVVPEWYCCPEVRNARLAATEEQKRAHRRKIEEDQEIEKQEARKCDQYWHSLSESDRQILRDEFRASSPLFQGLKDNFLEGIVKLTAWEHRPQMSTNAVSST